MWGRIHRIGVSQGKKILIKFLETSVFTNFYISMSLIIFTVFRFLIDHLIIPTHAKTEETSRVASVDLVKFVNPHRLKMASIK